MHSSVDLRRVVFALSCLLLLLDVAPAWAQQHRVLTILAMRREAPGSVVLDNVIQTVLSQELQGTLDYYSEHLDVGRFPDREYSVAIRDFLKRKYADHQFDLIVAPTNSAVEFVRGHREDLFPGVPVVFSTGPGATPLPQATGLTHTIEMAASVEMARQLQPHIRQVYVLSGASSSDKYYEALAREQLGRLENRLSIFYWSDLTFQDALQRVGTLPADAILYTMPFTADASGQRFNALPTFEAIAAAANVPVYHFSDLAIGYGTVGGALNSTEVLARGLAGLALRVLRGEQPDDIPVVPLDVLRYEVDWRQLRRWGISEARLPPGTEVHFREPGVWERYRWYIVSVGILLVFQTALIAGLLIQGERRRRTEAALRVSYQQNKDLAGRLITAQEAERTRIARDLHDDASQELAGLAMSLSLFKARLDPAVAGGELANALTELQQRTVALAEGLRMLSHELHPGVLQHAGLVAALRSHSAEFERRQGIRTTFEAAESFSDLDPEISLCLYRVAQEALTNAARHSGAADVVVTLGRSNGHVQLSVQDNGTGFDRSRGTSRGLGLRSIDERVHLRNGIASVTSEPGRGTQVHVSIPVADAPRQVAAGVL